MKKAELAARNKILEHQHLLDQHCIKQAMAYIDGMEKDLETMRIMLSDLTDQKRKAANDG